MACTWNIDQGGAARSTVRSDAFGREPTLFSAQPLSALGTKERLGAVVFVTLGADAPAAPRCGGQEGDDRDNADDKDLLAFKTEEAGEKKFAHNWVTAHFAYAQLVDPAYQNFRTSRVKQFAAIKESDNNRSRF